ALFDNEEILTNNPSPQSLGSEDHDAEATAMKEDANTQPIPNNDDNGDDEALSRTHQIEPTPEEIPSDMVLTPAQDQDCGVAVARYLRQVDVGRELKRCFSGERLEIWRRCAMDSVSRVDG
ncbi:MAG: hypothetical protein Q9169_008585, partial [Polycauliona sp. 2 TL-2023]